MGETLRQRVSDAEWAALGLWSVPGLGPESLWTLARSLDGRLERTLAEAPEGWVGCLTPKLQARLLEQGVDARARETARRCAAAGIEVCFRGGPRYPKLMEELEGMPPLLFYKGTLKGTRRRVAMVGSRHTSSPQRALARQFADAFARAHLGVVSGGAFGIDRECHQAALDAGGETWAFLGTALDNIDAAQRSLTDEILAGGGAVLSEYPPGARTAVGNFPRRNRLLSAASDATLIIRARMGSGTEHTAEAARTQGRALYAIPGAPGDETAAYCNWLLDEDRARSCSQPGVLIKHLTHGGRATSEPHVAPAGMLRVDGVALRLPTLEELSAEAQRAFGVLQKVPHDFETVQAECGLATGVLLGALVELETAGLVHQHPGRLYERV